MYRDLETKYRTSTRQSGRQVDNDQYRSPFDSDGPLGFPRKVQPLQLAPPTNPSGGISVFQAMRKSVSEFHSIAAFHDEIYTHKYVRISFFFRGEKQDFEN